MKPKPNAVAAELPGDPGAPVPQTLRLRCTRVHGNEGARQSEVALLDEDGNDTGETGTLALVDTTLVQDATYTVTQE